MIITWEIVAAFIVVATAFGGLWFRIEAMFRKNTDDLALFKLDVAKDYVSQNNLDKTLAPLKESLDRLTGRIDEFVGSVLRAGRDGKTT